MTFDLAKIDSLQKKLEEFRRLVSDPELMPLIERMVMDGNGANALRHERRTTEQPPRKLLFREGTQIAAIAKAAMECVEPFSGYDLAKSMQHAGHRFDNSNPGLSVTDVLRTALRKKGIVRVHKKGRGSEPMLFERVVS